MNFTLGQRSLWVFDFDGTLSPIVPDRNDARLHRECERMLRFLSRSPWNRVAVLSSRFIDDVCSRIPVQGVYIGGGSGLEWQLPGGHRVGPSSASNALLDARRRIVFPLFEELASIPGVEIEDKRWSVAVHYRNASPRSFRRRVSLLQRLRNRKEIKVFRGPEVVEVQMLGAGGKSAGVRRLCRLVECDPTRDRLVYAGDDENDAVAIRWVLSKGGTGIVVGNRISVHGAHHVEGPADLAVAVRELDESVPETRTAKSRGGTA
ncbi:MAG: trehalose-phosphatase [Deltaproteobacteria bacterium]